jgi:Sensors of blue-light using FAD
MAYSLLYVSKTLLQLPQAEAQVAEIVALSRSRNARLGVTGALVATSTYFAQLLEGPPKAVAELMESIDADARHMRVRIIRTAEEDRRFPDWSMVYTGYAGFVDRHIAPFFSHLPPGDAAHLATRLVALMEEYARLPAG